jgi:hypothetical protein
MLRKKEAFHGIIIRDALIQEVEEGLVEVEVAKVL